MTDKKNDDLGPEMEAEIEAILAEESSDVSTASIEVEDEVSMADAVEVMSKPAVREVRLKGVPALIQRAIRENKRINVVVEEGNEDESPDCMLSVNGRVCQIQRGMEVALRPEYVEVLLHAVTARLVKRRDGGGYQNREFPRFPFRTLGLEGE